MATSGNTNYNLTRANIVYDAMELINVKSVGMTPSASDVVTVGRTLDMLIKTWQSEGIGLWKQSDCTLFPEDGEYAFTIGPTGDHASLSYIKTEVATAGSETDTTLVVDSITGFGNTFDRNGILTATTPAGAGSLTLNGALVSGSTATLSSTRKVLIYSDADDSGVTFAVSGTNGAGATQTETITGPNTTTVYSTYEFRTVTAITISGAGTGNIEIGQVGDFVGIELDDDSLQWTNFGAAVTTTTLTFIDALTDDVAVDNHVYTYCAKPPRPLEIVEARIHYGSSDTETPLWQSGMIDYKEISDKTKTGIPNTIYFDPQLTNANLRVWPAFDGVQNWITFTGRFPIENFDVAGDEADFPQEWLLPLSYNLAIMIAPKFGRTPRMDLIEMARYYKEQAKGFDRDNNASIFFGVRRSFGR